MESKTVGIGEVFESIGVSESSKRFTSSKYVETSSTTGSEGGCMKLTTGSSMVAEGEKISCLGGWDCSATESWIWVI